MENSCWEVDDFANASQASTLFFPREGLSSYGGGACELIAPPDCRFTGREDRLYLYIFSRPLVALYLENRVGRVAYAQFLYDGSDPKISIFFDFCYARQET